MDDKWYSKLSQVYWTCRALIQGRKINHRDEIGETSGWRLGAIVHNLRRNYDWPIEVEYRGSERVAHYYLPEGCNWQSLRFPRSAKALKSEVQMRVETKPGDGQGASEDG